ncbi:MAG: hypothetical protein R3B52_00815 [Candidatus Paceibacterota bacterium]
MSLVVVFFLVALAFFSWAITSRDFSKSGELILEEQDGKVTVIARTDELSVEVQGDTAVAYIEGTLKDSCTEVLQVETLRDTSTATFDISVIAQRDENKKCESGTRNFTREVPLDTSGLERGDYIVIASEQVQTFSLGGDLVEGIYYVDGIDLLMLESFPLQMRAIVKGSLADGCTQIESVKSRFSAVGKQFTIDVATARDAEALCTQALVPFEESVTLDIYGLKAGEYTVRAKDKEEVFVLDQDNILQ